MPAILMDTFWNALGVGGNFGLSACCLRICPIRRKARIWILRARSSNSSAPFFSLAYIAIAFASSAMALASSIVRHSDKACLARSSIDDGGRLTSTAFAATGRRCAGSFGQSAPSSRPLVIE